MQQTRDNFDYNTFASDVLGFSDEQLGAGFNESQKTLMYNEAVKMIHEELLGREKGRGKETKTLKQSINLFEDARSILGVPEEIEDVNEPFAKESVLKYLESIPEGNRDLTVGDVIDKYTSNLYDDEFVEFERPFLTNYNKKIFKERLESKLHDGFGVIFKTPISDAITQLSGSIHFKNNELNDILVKGPVNKIIVNPIDTLMPLLALLLVFFYILNFSIIPRIKIARQNKKTHSEQQRQAQIEKERLKIV